MGKLSVLYVSGYQFLFVENTEELRDWCLCNASDDLKGTIILASEGINFSLCGPVEILEKYLSALFKRANLSCALRKSYADIIGFRKFLVKIKPEVVSYRCSDASYQPLSYLSVEDFHRWLSNGCDDSGCRLCLVDVRNEFEHKMGTFRGSINVPTRSFSEFHLKMAHDWVNKDSTIVTFCTGGIRCEKSSYWFQTEGIPAYQLEGGILRYLEVFSQGFFEGSCFVFDERISVSYGCLVSTNPCH
ncbi:MULTISPECIES: rhodanese-like domain-containing protein [Candidatus Ichthyocystis]|uniref:Putative sulphurtransferase, rhodanese family n=1 Tax=Candidatus Ichthyocystis hellenicum TaxID=1561003 RepID=A0A0S4M105_9BURK|nr:MULTISPECIES: rhodanese-like domain-containing protein [Ichthyocystis]CUT16955.1 putative sulphurtransferase, rhodanese family [Candidatus Ichthyocystis hellenicum]